MSSPTSVPGTLPIILVVDDDADVRESVTLLLEDEGYTVHGAPNGQQALAVLERIPRPSLVIADLRMPVMDGVQLIEAMRSDPRWTSVPVLAFSAASVVAVPGGTPLLRKPVSVDPLIEAVRSHAARN